MSLPRTDEAPTDANRPYRPYGAAERLFRCRDAEILIEGPAGTGKSRAVLEKVHFCAEKYPGARILLVRKTRESMTESTLVTLHEKVLPVGHPAGRGAQRRMRQAYHYPNGSEVVVGGLDKTEKIMSTEFDMICAFEATELTENDWETLTTRNRNGVLPYQQCVADCNPSAGTHWLNRRADTDLMARLVSRHEDNPEVTPEYLAKLDRLTGVRYLRLRLGKWAAAEGMIYESFDPAVHVIDPFPIPDDWRRIRCVDFGYTNPFVCQWWAIDGDGRMYLYRELYKRQTLVEDHTKRIAELTGNERIEATPADHDAEDRATMERHGITTLAAHKAVLPGIEAVQLRLRPAGDGKPRLYIMRGCLVDADPALAESHLPTCTEQEFDGYVWQPTKDGRAAKEEPVKVNDHGMDAMRYAVAHVDDVSGSRQRIDAGLWVA